MAACLLVGALAIALLPVPAAARDSPASAPASGEVRLADLANRLRGKPEEALAAFEALAAGEPAGTMLWSEALLLLGRAQLELGDSEAADRTAARLEAAGGGAYAGLAATVLRADLHLLRGPISRADRLAGEALAKLPAQAPWRWRLRLLGLHAAIKSERAQFDESVRLYQQAIGLADQDAPAWRRADLRSSLAYTLYLAGHADRAREVNREALELAREAKDAYSLSNVMTTQAIVLTDTGQDDAELRAMQQAIDYAVQAGARRPEVLARANIVDWNLRHGQYSLAYERSAELLPLTRALRDPTSEAVALANMGLAAISLRRLDEGLRLVRESMAVSERNGSLAESARTLDETAGYLERAGFHAEAVRALRDYRGLADEAAQRGQEKALLELQESADYERRQRELAALEADKRLTQAQLRNRMLQQSLWVGLAVLAALLAAAGVLLLRRMAATNRRLARTNAKLLAQSERDPLTGLANRRHFHAVMRDEGGDAVIDGSVFLIDIDHFKHLNDRWGHAIGDAVLVEIARRMQATLRGRDLVVRWGGEEFLVVVRALAPDAVEALAQRLLDEVGGRPIATEQGPVTVTASIGFATFPLEPARKDTPWPRGIDIVDTTMYLAKSHGRNRAYGVRMLDIDATWSAEALDAAWREGHVTLVALSGPVAERAAEEGA